jgi:hypothetical protein
MNNGNSIDPPIPPVHPEVTMKGVICAVVGTVLLCSAATDAAQRGGKGGKKGHDVQDTSISIHVTFSSGDVKVLRAHYGPRFKNLPPGLQKKLARGGSLPPGWQRKIEPFPVVLERSLPSLPQGYSRGVIDAHAVIYNSRGMIIDVAVLF